MDLIQRSTLALNDGELEKLSDNGFVVTSRQRFPTYSNGYSLIYADDLPLYVSADSILDALHQSYDRILEDVELQALIPELQALLSGARGALAGAGSELGTSTADVDFFYAVALSLLTGAPAAPVAGADEAAISSFAAQAEQNSGYVERELFGVPRQFDFSQFEPRGHYTDRLELQRYFRAMIWLGRIDFRLIETEADGSRVFHRRQLEATLGIGQTIRGTEREHWNNIDAVVGAFVGESDYMRLPEIDALLSDLGVASISELNSLSDSDIAQSIIDGGYGAQRISSHIMMNGMAEGGTLPLSRSFAVMGQRYIVDSHVFSNLVFDRVRHGQVMRMLPDPLDVAFAALENDDAARLLSDELDQFEYQGDLQAMRLLVDAHEPGFWQENLYNQWLGSLRALSPSEQTQNPTAFGLPNVVGTEAWGRRILNTQLSSWAQLRHDTILYAKQSYTNYSCEFPDAYVDPYPAFYDGIGNLAASGQELADRFATLTGPLAERIRSYFVELGRVAQMLGDMARAQRSGTPFSEEQMAFINEAVVAEGSVCGMPPTYSGWYPRLIFDQTHDGEPTIADVHTQPKDEAGNIVGRVLHVGTGGPRLMVVTADTCGGPKAYVGLAATYHELVTLNFKRLTDQEWAAQVDHAADVDWVEPILAP